jgi:hypothetical protein
MRREAANEPIRRDVIRDPPGLHIEVWALVETRIASVQEVFGGLTRL